MPPPAANPPLPPAPPGLPLPPAPPAPPRHIASDEVVVERQAAPRQVDTPAQAGAAVATGTAGTRLAFGGAGRAVGSHGLVVDHGHVRERDRAAVVQESATLAGRAPRDRETDDIDLGIGVNREDAEFGRPRGAAAGHGQRRRSGAVDRRV